MLVVLHLEEAMTHELSILTNDGWVVTLVSDKEIAFNAVISTIIVQPKEDFIERVKKDDDGVSRRFYRLNRQGEQEKPS